MTPELKITIGQLNPTIGDLDGNIALMLDAARRASADGADMVVFPELSLTGYSPGDLLDDPDFVHRLRVACEDLRAASRQTPGLHWVVGLPAERPAGGGKRFYNALQVLLDGKVVLEQFKQLLPTYGVFDEARHFAPGPDVAKVLRVGMAQVGFAVCEDLWNAEGRDYQVNPYQRLSDAAVDLVISINASPSQKGKRQVRHSLFSAACARYRLPLLYVAQVGGHDQLVYDGASFAVEPGGEIVYEAARFATEVRTLRFDLASQGFTSLDGESLPNVPTEGLAVPEFYQEQIVLGLRDYARRCGFKSALVGSSGGIDSALTLALAAQALGPENVVAITMPSVYSSAGSVSDSVALCSNLGIRLIKMPIRDTVITASATFAAAMGEAPRGLALENLQARVRGTLLMTYSNQYGHLLLTTGNKSECGTGYCTLYGDTNGGLGLIGDLYKTEVFALARHINAATAREIIPVAILGKPPSAELAPGQQDSDSLPAYEVLDEILKVLLEGDLLDPAEHRSAHAFVQQLAAKTEGAAVIARVKGLIARSEFKRRQAPPIIRLRARAFGNGRQLPIAARHY